MARTSGGCKEYAPTKRGGGTNGNEPFNHCYRIGVYAVLFPFWIFPFVTGGRKNNGGGGAE